MAANLCDCIFTFAACSASAPAARADVAAKAEATVAATLRGMLRAGADPNAPGQRSRQRHQGSPLHLAAQLCPSAGPARLLLEAKAQVDILDAEGRTPLHLAAQRGTADIVEALVASGAEADARDGDGYTPLHMAARAGQRATLRALLLAGADGDHPLPRRPEGSPLPPLPHGQARESVCEHLLSVSQWWAIGGDAVKAARFQGAAEMVTAVCDGLLMGRRQATAWGRALLPAGPGAGQLQPLLGAVSRDLIRLIGRSLPAVAVAAVVARAASQPLPPAHALPVLGEAPGVGAAGQAPADRERAQRAWRRALRGAPGAKHSAGSGGRGITKRRR